MSFKALAAILFSKAERFEEEEKAGCFAFVVLQMYCYYKCSVALPHGAVGWSALCDSAEPFVQFGRRHYEHHICEIILNLDKWIKRCHLKEKILHRRTKTNHNSSP